MERIDHLRASSRNEGTLEGPSVCANKRTPSLYAVANGDIYAVAIRQYLCGHRPTCVGSVAPTVAT